MSLNNNQQETAQRRRDIELAIGILLLLAGGRRIPRRIPARSRQRALRQLTARTRRSGRNLGQQLNDGDITQAQWFVAMAELVRSTTIASGAVWDGITALSNPEFEILDIAANKDIEFLRKFRQQIAAGDVAPGQIVNRSGNYGKVRGTYYEIAGYNLETDGFTEERNILFPGDSCTNSSLPGCIQVTRLGWQPIGTLPLIGNRTCHNNDRCELRYKNSETGQEMQV